jgi:LmbE family N-acetylglucosaminyl deacetylase
MEKRLLAVLAHPDDESFGMGGTLALYASRGAAAHLVCATRGEAGDVDPVMLPPGASVAKLRENELRCAAGALGLAGVHFLGYRDSGMPGSPDNAHPDAQINAPLDQVAARVAAHIRRIRPQVVLTFDPIGGYRHPDHIHIHNATVMAFQLAADPSADLCALDPAMPPAEAALPPYQAAKLYFHTIPRGFFKLAVRLLPLFGRNPRRWGRNGDIDLLSLAEVDFPTDAVIDYGPVRERKQQASVCHASQGGVGMATGIGGFILRLGGAKETFMRAVPPAAPGRRETDLFAGIS